MPTWRRCLARFSWRQFRLHEDDPPYGETLDLAVCVIIEERFDASAAFWSVTSYGPSGIRLVE